MKEAAKRGGLIALGIVNILRARGSQGGAFRETGPDQCHLQEDGAVLRGFHGARQFKALRREVAIRIAPIHLGHPFQAANAAHRDRFPSVGNQTYFLDRSKAQPVKQMTAAP
jgi:hypothetical protein